MTLTPVQLEEFDRCARHIYAHVMEPASDLDPSWYHADPVFISGEFTAGIHELETVPEVLYVAVARQLGLWPASCCAAEAMALTVRDSSHEG